jgi:aspartate carbamoyltransferase regulatory subunit
MDKELRELKVTAIEHGTVIDHIPANNVFRVIRILNLDNTDNQILFGVNLESHKYGRKGIIKVSNMFFAKEEINKIALVAPTATLIVIRNFKVESKTHVEVPDQIDNITNQENIPTRFTVIDKNDLRLQCHYCEKITVKNNISFL